MKILHLKKTFLLAGLAGFLVLPVTSQAAVIAVDDATFTPALDSGTTMLDDTTYNLASITVDSVVYTNLEGSTATNVAHESNGFQFHTTTTGSDPGTDNESVSGLTLSVAMANISSGAIFQFGSPLQSYQGFAGFELGGDDAFELTLVDSSGDEIGTTPYTLSASTYGSTLATPDGDGWNRPTSSNTDRFGATSGPNGTFFEFSDFSNGVGGDLSQATGFKLTGATGLDPFAVVAVVPEPSGAALLLGAGACLLLLRRRRLGA